MADHEHETGRVAQRRRTRKGIVAATAALLAQGKTPSVTEVAEAADVSRRTVYMYFPTIEQLLIDASLLALTRDTVDAALDTLEGEEDVEHRVEIMTRAVQRNFGATEQAGRTLLRLTVDSPGGDQPKRGFRRVEWIERAVAPLRAKLDPEQFERLVSALAMVIGWEAMIVQRDVRGLSLEDAESVSAWAARALVKASLEDVKPAHLRAKRRPKPKG